MKPMKPMKPMKFITAREWYAKRGIKPKEMFPGGPLVLIDPALPGNRIYFADLDHIIISIDDEALRGESS